MTDAQLYWRALPDGPVLYINGFRLTSGSHITGNIVGPVPMEWSGRDNFPTSGIWNGTQMYLWAAGATKPTVGDLRTMIGWTYTIEVSGMGAEWRGAVPPPAPEVRIGVTDPIRFFAGTTEITELYAGTNKIWEKEPERLEGVWDATNAKLIFPGPQLPMGTYEVDIPLWGDVHTSPVAYPGKIGWTQTLASSNFYSLTRIDGTSQTSPTFADMVYGLQGSHARLVVDNSLNVTLTVLGLNPNVLAGFAATLLRSPDAWIPMDTSVGLVDMSGHKHSMLTRSISYSTDGPVFPYGAKGHYVGGNRWLKLNMSSTLTSFTISTWFIPKVVSHLDSSSVVFGSMPYAAIPAGAFYFGEVDFGLATLPITPGIQLQVTSGGRGVHPGTSSTHLNRWPQFQVNVPYHIVVRSDRTVWINGEKRLHNQMDTTEPFPLMSILAASGLSIGAAKEYEGTMYAFADGWVGNFAYWKRALSDADIAAIYQAGRVAA